MSDVTESSDTASDHDGCRDGERSDDDAQEIGPFSSTDCRKNLLASLETIGHGSFATSGWLPDVNPGLYVESLGKIGLPLSERDAAALAQVCHEAPFGKGSETFVDTAVRKTWQINPDKVHFRNSKWPEQVNHAVSKVTAELGMGGVMGTVRAELHKLLLYEPGAFFDTHRDTEKAPGMIATMVISLPSEHTGGDVVLNLNGQKMTLQTQDAGEFLTKYVAWYADVNHSVQPVVSGHRLVLTYNLIREGPERSTLPPPSVLFDPTRNLQLAMKKWQIETERSGHLIHMLEHRYSEANFGLHSLKGHDQARATYLCQAAKKHDVCIYFAHFKHTVSGGVDDDDDDDDDDSDGYRDDVEIHDIMDEYDSDWTLTTLFTTEGRKIAEDLEMDPEDFVEEERLEEEGPDYEDYEGWTGNEGASTTHYYHRSCIVMFPKKWRYELLRTASSIVLEEWAKLAFHDLKQANDSPSTSLIAELTAISEQARRPRSSSIASMKPTVFVDLALRLKEPSLLKAATGEGLELETCRRLGSSGIRLLDENWLHEIQTALTNEPRGTKRLEAINALATAVHDASRTNEDRAEATVFEQALVRSLPKIWCHRYDETVRDADSLASLCTDDREDVLRETLLPIAKKSTNITFLQNLAHNVTAKVVAGEIRLEAGKDFCDQVLGNLALSIRSCCPFLDREWSAVCLKDGDLSEKLLWEWGSRNQHLQPVFTGPKFAALIETCETVQSSRSARKMLGILTDISRKEDKRAFSDFLLPVLASLPPVGAVANLEPYMALFRTVISSYTDQFVPTHPQKIEDWSSPKRGCSSVCKDCRDLDRFLTSIDQSETRFSMAAPRRKHLEQQLKHGDLNINTETWSGSPYKLVVRKIHSVWRDDVESLQKTRQSAINDIFSIGNDKLQRMLGEKQYSKLHSALGIRYTQVPSVNEVEAERAPLADVPNTTMNTQGTKRPHGQAFDEKANLSKRSKQGPEIVDLEAEDQE